MAGYRELLAVEWDDNAVEVFKSNFPGIPVHHGDIALLSVEEVLKRTGLKPGELDVLDGSPPCQGFSTTGKRNLNDPRNQLFREYVRLLKGLMPKVFVMENVSGMVKGKMKLLFAEIITELKAAGYDVSARLLNAKWFGVPQSRDRMIFIGVRKDLGFRPSHPKPIYRTIPALIAIRGAKPDDIGKPDTKYAERMKAVKPGRNLSRAEGTTSGFSMNRCPINRPCMTVTKMTFAGVSIWHPLEDRNLSIAEAKRICSFPAEFKFTGEYKDKWARMGNSVPPIFMKAVAAHIRENILTQVG